MKGTYGDLNRIRKKIIKHQNLPCFHPLTCGNDSKHLPLDPQLLLSGDEFELMLVCNDCNWKQDIPDFIANELI